MNGIKYLSFDRDQRLVTQNSGLMLETQAGKFYGHLDYVVEVIYADDMSVVLFKGIWHNTIDDVDDEELETVKLDYGMISVDTNTCYYEDSPFCLALKTKQVFFVEDPKAGGTWNVVQEMSHRNVYTAVVLATEDHMPPSGNQITEPYQEDTITALQFFHINASDVQVELQVEEPNEESSGYAGQFNSDDDNKEDETDAHTSESYDDEDDL